jgi:hypothetical protein
VSARRASLLHDPRAAWITHSLLIAMLAAYFALLWWTPLWLAFVPSPTAC